MSIIDLGSLKNITRNIPTEPKITINIAAILNTIFQPFNLLDFIISTWSQLKHWIPHLSKHRLHSQHLAYQYHLQLSQVVSLTSIMLMFHLQ